MDVPSWGVALVLAVIAPFCARALGDAFEKNARARTVRALGSIRGAARRTAEDDGA